MAVNISKWVAAEIHKTELELLRAEDELANAQLRVAALQQRAQRLKGKQQHLPVVDEQAGGFRIRFKRGIA